MVKEETTNRFTLNQMEKLSLAEAMENSLNELFIFDAAEYKFKYISKGAMTNLGYPIVELKRMHPWDIKPISGSEFLDMISPLVDGSVKMMEFEIDHIRTDGSTYPVEVHLQPCLFGGQPCYQAFILDVSDKKKLTEGLIQSSKLASLGEMAGGVAHEINNPLGIISGYTMIMQRMLKNGDLDTVKLDSILGKTASTIERISKIVKGMRSLSRDGSADPLEPEKVEEILLDSLSICSEKFKNAGVSLSLEIENRDVAVSCRKTEISQIILNLLGNSYDAVENLDTKWVKLVASGGSDTIQVRVIDSGPKVEKEHQGKMLEPFYTTKKAGKGVGLGLSMSKTLAEKNNGRLFFDFSHTNTEAILELSIAGADSGGLR